MDFKDNILRFFLPTTISPRYVPADVPDEEGIPVNSKIHPEYADKVSYGLHLQIDVLKAEDMDPDSISSPSHKIKTSFKDDHYRIEFTADEVKMDRDFIVEIEYKNNNLNNAFYLPGEDESFVQVDFTPDFKTLFKNNCLDFVPVATNVVFLLDCSGSMQGSSINQAKKALEILIKALKPKQKFNIYRFGSSFDRLSGNFLEFNKETLNRALVFLDNTDADFGGTEILAPFENIILWPPKYLDFTNKDDDEHISEQTSIVLITDGEVGNEQEVLNLAKSNRQSFRIFTVSIGYEPNEYFIKNLAKVTGGDYMIVHPEERIDLKIISLFKKLNIKPLENLRIDLGIDENLIEQSPESLAIYDNLTCSIYARIKKTLIPEKIALKGVYNGMEVRWDFPLINQISRDETTVNEYDFIPKFWAWEKIRDLENSSFTRQGSQQIERKYKNIDNQIIELSKKYGVVSSKTSFVSIEERNEDEKTKGEIKLVKVPTLITYGWHGRDKHIILEHMNKNIEKFDSMRGFKADVLYCLNFDKSSNDYCSKAYKCIKRERIAEPNWQVHHDEIFKHDILVEILSCQMPGGGFQITQHLSESLKIKIAEIKKTAASITLENHSVGLNEKIKLFSTALIIKILEEHFKDDKNSWQYLVEKSVHWYEKVLAKYKPAINKQPLGEFINEFVFDLGINDIIS